MSKIMGTTERLLAEALQLPPEERERLADAIWDSLPAEFRSGEFTEEEKAELDKRLAAVKENPSAGYSWEEVKARHRKRK
jgi:putative addiction module component (TIGR02574 family)